MKARSVHAQGLLAMLAVLAAACGGGGGTTTPSSPNPQPSTSTGVRTPLLTGSTFTVRAGGSSFTNIDFPPVGTVDVTVNWGGSNRIEVYITDASCPGFQNVTSGSCAVIARAEGTAKPKSLTFPSQTGRIYTVWSANRGTSDETVSLDAGVTTSGPLNPVPTPQPSTAPDPRDGWAPGPVTQVKAYLKTLESSKGSRNYRPAEQDAQGNWIVYVGEYIVVDSTQRNGAGQICRWIDDPEYDFENDDRMMDVTGSSEPFFFKFHVDRPGIARVWSAIDGIKSNILSIKAVRK